MTIASLPFFEKTNKRLDEFCLLSSETKVVGKLPIHSFIREYAQNEHKIIEVMEKLDFSELQALKRLNRNISRISQDKCTYYSTSFLGALKRITSCFFNAIYFGKWQSSGQLGSILSEKIGIQIDNRIQIVLNEESKKLQAVKDKLRAEKVKQAKVMQAKEAQQNQVDGVEKNKPSTSEDKPTDNVVGIIDPDLVGQPNFRNPVPIVSNTEKKEEIIFPASNLDNSFVQIEDDESDLEGEPNPLFVLPSAESIEQDKSPRGDMNRTFLNVWKHAADTEKACLFNFWNTLLKGAKIESWTKTNGWFQKNTNSYCLTLEKELAGTKDPKRNLIFGDRTISNIPGKTVLSKEIYLSFSEEKIPGSDTYAQIISLSSGISHEAGGVIPNLNIAEMRLLKDEDSITYLCLKAGKWPVYKEFSFTTLSNLHEFFEFMHWE